MAKAIEFEIKIKGNSGVLKTITVEATNADEAIGRIVESASNAGDALRRMAENSLIFDTSVRALENLNGIVSGLANPYNSFETAMRAANTMAGKNEEGFSRLTDTISEMSAVIPKTREELADGLYQAISNGVPEDNWISFLDRSARSSVGGIANLGETVAVTSTIIKNYGRSWDEAGAIQDKIQMTAKNGVTTFGLLAQALPRVTGSAAQLGVEIDELMAVFATTTGVTGNTAEVSTQLGAVLNSLIKPTAEATKAADAMGIQFDAASIKAAGGFENFLTQLDESVQAYAASSGQLSQTIYGQLFGSAEALRLLGSLTGEQKDKFSQNIKAMADSAGSIDEAFDQMSSTGDSWAQKVKNWTQQHMDWVGAIASTAAPLVELGANTGSLLLSMAQLYGLVGKIKAGIAAWNIVTKAAAATQVAVATATKVWSVAQIALNAILTANPIGVIIMAVAALVAGIMLAYDQCEGFRKICDQVWDVVKQVASAIWDYLVIAFEKVSEVVKKAWEWVKAFFGIEDESSAREVADGLERQADSMERLADATKEATAAGIANGKSLDWQKMSYQELGKAIEAQKEKVARLAGTGSPQASQEAERLRQMEARYKSLGRNYGLSDASGEYDGKALIANARSYNELANNITYYQNRLDRLAPSETEEIRRLSGLIVAAEREQEAIKHLQEAYSQPAELKSLADVDGAIELRQKLMNSASAEQIANYKAEISALETLKREMLDMSHVPMAVEEIETYNQLEAELSYYQDALRYAGAAEREEIQKRINELNNLKKSWDEALSVLKTPADIGALDNIAGLEEAINIYSARMKGASDDELVALRRTTLALEEKLAAKKRLALIPESQMETERLSGLTGKKLTMELQLIGLDGVKSRLRDLRRMLEDTRNPLTEEQRRDTINQVEAWEEYERQLLRSNFQIKDAWGGVRGLGDGMRGLSDAVRGDGDAWEKVTGIVDSAISVYESANQVVRMAGVISRILGIAKNEEAVSTITATTATTAGATAGTAAAAQEAAASGVVTTAKVAEAGAKTMAAHASIPWVGIAIAGGMIAAMTGIMLSLPKFADGGIAYGPTLGIFGEYAGAAHNPEVVAPLDKLRALIGPAMVTIPNGRLEIVARGREMYGVIRTEELIRSRR